MNAIRIPHDLDERIATAIEFFWTTRNGQLFRQTQSGIHDQGNRGAIALGKQLDGVIQLM